MDFSHLDDPHPPAPDASVRAQVRAIAGRRRHARVAYESAAALVVVVAVVGAVVATRGGSSSVQVSTHPTSPTAHIKTFHIASNAMAPTLTANSRAPVDEGAYSHRRVQRGDIIVFKAPPGEASATVKDLVKRVIGLPGDTVEARDEHVFIIPAGMTTGHDLEEPYVRPTPECPAGIQSPVAGRPLDTPTRVPAGEYYVMGDNRCASEDSRAFGPIKQSSIIGRAFVHVGTPPADVTVQIELDHDIVAPGGTITGHVVFDNPTGRTMAFTSGTACVNQYQIVIGTATPGSLAWPQPCLSERANGGPARAVPGFLVAPPGVTRVPFTVSAAGAVFTPRIRPLPKGRALVYFVPERRSPHLITPAPVPIVVR